MSRLIETIKANATVLSSVVTFVATVAGGIIFVDNRYAHAQSITQQQTATSHAIENLRTESQIQFENMQINSLDDKIFYLEQKTTKTPGDQAQLNRFQRQRQDSVDRVRSLQARVPPTTVSR